MPSARNEPDNFRYWARNQFATLRRCVAYLETTDANENTSIGTCFHVGEGIFVTARHVVESRTISIVGFDDSASLQHSLNNRENWGKKSHGSVSIVDGPYFHPEEKIDVACFRINPIPDRYIPLGGHFDDLLGQFDLLLYRTLVMGYPPIPLSERPVLFASVGEVNALVDLYLGGHPHFIVSTMARGGFSGAPVLVAYNEDNQKGGTAILGMVTASLTANHNAPENGYMAVLTVEPIYTCLEKHGMLPKCQTIGHSSEDT